MRLLVAIVLAVVPLASFALGEYPGKRFFRWGDDEAVYGIHWRDQAERAASANATSAFSWETAYGDDYGDDESYDSYSHTVGIKVLAHFPTL